MLLFTTTPQGEFFCSKNMILGLPTDPKTPGIGQSGQDIIIYDDQRLHPKK